MDGVRLTCNVCGGIFLVCRKCWSCQVYCSVMCRKTGRARSRRKTQARYPTSVKGRASHSERQRRYRAKRRDKNTETDQSTKLIEEPLHPSQAPVMECWICKSRLDQIWEISLLGKFRSLRSFLLKQRKDEKNVSG